MTLLAASGIVAVTFGRYRHRGNFAAQAVAVSAGIITLSLAWWQIAPLPFAPGRLLAFASLLVACDLAFASDGGRAFPTVGTLTAFACAAVTLLVNVGGYLTDPVALQTIGHHWGAFIGPALHVRAGLIPFVDVPLQYGAGPTTLILAFCDDARCWRGGEMVFVGSAVLQGVLLLHMAIASRRSAVQTAVITIAMFAATLLWTGQPSLGALALGTPSDAGMRYLPVTLVGYLFFFDRPRAAAAALALAVIWSPETAVMATMVYGGVVIADLGPWRAARSTTIIIVTAFATFVLVHRIIFGQWIEPAAFLEYMNHVPGPMPAMPISDTLVLFGGLVVATIMIVQRTVDLTINRRDRVVTWLLFSTATIWFGRSHPNSVCNLAPFLLLVALRYAERVTTDLSRSATRFVIATAIAALALAPWQMTARNLRWQLDPDVVSDATRKLEPGIERIRQRIANPGGLGIADIGGALVRHPSETLIWTALDPGSLWPYVPHRRRQLYLQRSSVRLGRSGFVIFEENEYPLIQDFHDGYQIASVARFEGAAALAADSTTHYTVICFDPRLSPATRQVGPRCPTMAVTTASAVTASH